MSGLVAQTSFLARDNSNSTSRAGFAPGLPASRDHLLQCEDGGPQLLAQGPEAGRSGSFWLVTARVIYEFQPELARVLFADFDASARHIVAQPFLINAAGDATASGEHKTGVRSAMLTTVALASHAGCVAEYDNSSYNYHGFDKLEGRPYSYDQFADLCGQQSTGQLTGVWESRTSPLVARWGIPPAQYVAVIDTNRYVFVRSLPCPSQKLLSMRLSYTDSDRYFLTGILTIHSAHTRCWDWGVDFMERIHFLFSPERQSLDGTLDNQIQLRTPGDRRIPEQDWPLKRRSRSLDRATLDQFVDGPA